MLRRCSGRPFCLSLAALVSRSSESSQDSRTLQMRVGFNRLNHRLMSSSGKLVSLNVGAPRRVPYSGKTVLTSIFKSPVSGRVGVRATNIDGDKQADLTVHGGKYKAVYCYPEEHYSFWSAQLPDTELVPGMFGENLTTQGLLEDVVCIGDRFRVGTAALQVTQPRMPCYKLGIRFGRPDIIKRFWDSNRPGIYFSVLEEGETAAGDAIESVGSESDAVSVADVVALYKGEKADADLLERALRAPLFGGWKKGLRERRSL
jgi:MOSC domain-containing protein YiiM